jgi:hypothetical protein
MMSARLAVALALAAGLAGCGERTGVTVYKQGQYQGKPDTAPWDNERFERNRGEWLKAVRARTDGQNEYVRIGTQ